MGFLAQAVAERKAAVSIEKIWDDILIGGVKSKAGPSVTLQNAFRVSAFLACMRAISQGLAQVPFKLMQEYEQGDLTRRKPARDHHVYDLVTAKPNQWQTAYEQMETLGLHASMGNAYVYKNIVRGKLKQLILLDPGRVKPQQSEDLTPVYVVTGKDGERKNFDASLIWHVRGPSWDGLVGMDTLNMMREALGLSIALEESAASLHANGVRPTGVYSIDATLDTLQYEQLTNWLKKQAAADTGTPLIIDKGAKWQNQTMTSVDAQHREMRDMQIEEVARFFGVLPTIIGYTGDKANTYASAEVMETAHKVRTLGPWYKRVEDSANVNLLSDLERKQGYYFKFITNALMAANAKDRGDFYSKALGNGGAPAFMTQDEVRELEDLDPFGGAAAKLPPRLGAENTESPGPAPSPT